MAHVSGCTDALDDRISRENGVEDSKERTVFPRLEIIALGIDVSWLEDVLDRKPSYKLD